MKTFLGTVTEELINKFGNNLNELLLVVPNKRASVFIKYEISKRINTPVFSPKIVSVEEFIEDVSNCKKITDLEALFQLFDIYQKEIKTPEQIENFLSWGKTILSDFNEIDRHLADPELIFNYLNEIKKIESDHWSIESKSHQVSNYIQFWDNLNTIYTNFQKHLLKNNTGYQGLIYRKASEHIGTYIPTEKHIVFLGFNALNKAEESIIKTLISQKKASIYWDIDQTFIERTYHDAGYFLRNYTFEKKNAVKNINWITNNYSNKKKITVHKASNGIEETQIASEILKQFNKEEQKKVVLVLADENLLNPMINLIPLNINKVNITMGIPIKKSNSYDFFDTLLNIIEESNTLIYHKHIKTLLSNPICQLYFKETSVCSHDITHYINNSNLSYVSASELCNNFPEIKNKINLLFSSWSNSINESINRTLKIVEELYKSLYSDSTSNSEEIQVLFHIKTIFERLGTFVLNYNFIKSFKAVNLLFKEFCSKTTLDFKGDALEGLQIMGLLETRTLDFENVIITSVNEGILPGGKTQNSFLPHELKVKNNIPTYKEKDAVFSYHFYRLLSRAKNIHLIYNSETDALNGGEKSRFITQMEIEGIHNINLKHNSKPIPHNHNVLLKIPKTEKILKIINENSEKGYSPSALTTYIRNPIDFYKRRVLRIQEDNLLDETIASNTLGTIIHKTLEELYKPYINTILNEEILNQLIKLIDKTTLSFLHLEYNKEQLSGKNQIIFEVAKRFIYNFINNELKEVKNGTEIIIKALEHSLSCELKINGIATKIKLYGEIDRIDSCDGIIRIIDYKTGLVNKTDVTVKDWSLILTDYKKYSKSFQLLTYAYLFLNAEHKIPYDEIETGIYSFRNLKEGFIKFNYKPTSKISDAVSRVNSEIINAFEEQLIALIKEIHDMNIPFTEKEV